VSEKARDPASSAGAPDEPPPASGRPAMGFDPISVSAATAITHFGPECPSCSQVNHAGTIRCVFCGQVLVAVAPTKSAWTEAAPGDAAPASARATAAQQALAASSQGSSAGVRRPATWSTPFDDLQHAVADPLIGVVVADRYRIVEGLGRGGMGIVYKVEHKQIGKLLAMKLLTGELSRNPEVVRRFKHEALTSSRLSSPNTVQVFDFGVSDGLTYLVMELIAGEDLGRILRTSGPMPWNRLGKVIIQSCSSLAEAHTKGIVHRDIKPENIMLVRARDGSDVAKVLDFGLAKLREGEGLSELTSAGAIVGTPYFMSPEQVRGDPVDARSDIYSLGALMYRALTGHYPFNGPTPMSVFTKHLTEIPMAPTERAPELGIPGGVSRIVMRSLLKNPADRFQRVEDLQAAIVDQMRELGRDSVETLLDSGAVRQLENVPVQASDPGRAEIATRDEVERYERKLRRQRYSVYAVLAVMLLGAGGAAAKLSTWRTPAFTGAEVEPNDLAGEATPVPFGRTVRGQLGRRLDAAHGDRDFFAVDVPAPRGGEPTTYVKIQVTGLPNIPMCTMLYRPGLSTALGQYCVGRAGRELLIPSLRLEPGRYFAAVLQDMDPYGASARPFIHENISDVFSMTMTTGEYVPGTESEPDDQVASANLVAPYETVTGALGWARDQDVYCVRAGPGERVRWTITDSVRDLGAVLEVTPLRGTEEGAAVRVHLAGSGTVSPTASSSDVIGPWASPPLEMEPDVPRCVRVRLALDPWATGRGSIVPSGGPETYKVQVEAPP
jgi:hypothetical protein